MDTYRSVLPEVDATVTEGLTSLRTGTSRGIFAASGENDETPGTGSAPFTRGFMRGAEGSRTPGLLDATEAL
jgi:hypothetical protein